MEQQGSAMVPGQGLGRPGQSNTGRLGGAMLSSASVLTCECHRLDSRIPKASIFATRTRHFRHGIGYMSSRAPAICYPAPLRQGFVCWAARESSRSPSAQRFGKSSDTGGSLVDSMMQVSFGRSSMRRYNLQAGGKLASACHSLW